MPDARERCRKSDGWEGWKPAQLSPIVCLIPYSTGGRSVLKIRRDLGPVWVQIPPPALRKWLSGRQLADLLRLISEPRLFGLGYAFEAATRVRRDPVTTPPLRGEQIRR